MFQSIIAEKKAPDRFKIYYDSQNTDELKSGTPSWVQTPRINSLALRLTQPDQLKSFTGLRKRGSAKSPTYKCLPVCSSGTKRL